MSRSFRRNKRAFDLVQRLGLPMGANSHVKTLPVGGGMLYWRAYNARLFAVIEADVNCLGISYLYEIRRWTRGYREIYDPASEHYVDFGPVFPTTPAMHIQDVGMKLVVPSSVVYSGRHDRCWPASAIKSRRDLRRSKHKLAKLVGADFRNFDQHDY